MARRTLHPTGELLDAARELVLVAGPRAAGIRELSSRSGAPSGSLYHRFGTRDNVIALTWLRAARKFQAGFLVALTFEDDPLQAATMAVRWSAMFAIDNPADTELLLRFGRDDLLDGAPRADIAAELAGVNDELQRLLRRLARRLFPAGGEDGLERTTMAVIDLPYAALRRHLLAGTLDAGTAPALERAALAILGATPGSGA